MGSLRSCYLLALSVLALVFLLSGERPPSDPRFASPATTVNTFWRALAEDTPGAALECFVEVGATPSSRRLMRLPALARLELRRVTVTPKGTDRALVRYEIHYRVRGARQGGAFATGDELLRVRGQWRIVRPVWVPGSRLQDSEPPRPAVHVAPGPDFA
jgi:hypothetical protein